MPHQKSVLTDALMPHKVDFRFVASPALSHDSYAQQEHIRCLPLACKPDLSPSLNHVCSTSCTGSLSQSRCPIRGGHDNTNAHGLVTAQRNRVAKQCLQQPNMCCLHCHMHIKDSTSFECTHVRRVPAIARGLLVSMTHSDAEHRNM